MTSFGSNLQLHIQQSVEESAVPLEGDAQIFSRDVVAATPLPLQSRTRIGEAICQALDYFGNQRISLLDFRDALEKNISDLEKAYWQLVQGMREVRIA